MEFTEIILHYPDDYSFFEILYYEDIDFEKNRVLFYTKNSFKGELDSYVEEMTYLTEKEASIEVLKSTSEEKSEFATGVVEIRVYIVPNEIENIIIIQDNKHIEVPMKDPNEMVCSAYDTLNNSMTNYGMVLELEVQRCQEEGHPVKIKAVIKNENDYPVMYSMGSIGDPAIYTHISNPYFSVSTPSNPNDPFDISPAIDYQSIPSKESIVRETTWDNTLVSGLLAPNGDYNISVNFRYVGNADLIDLTSSRDTTTFSTSIQIEKKHSESFLTPEDALDKILDDIEVKEWLDDHEGLLCEKQDKHTMAEYIQGVWTHTSYSNAFDEQEDEGKYCLIGFIFGEKAYRLTLADKFYMPSSISKKIDLMNGSITTDKPLY